MTKHLQLTPADAADVRRLAKLWQCSEEEAICRAIRQQAEDVIYVPDVPSLLSPLVSVIPLQLLAYEIAVRRCCDVDQPRNLAKTVTVDSSIRQILDQRSARPS